MMSSMADAKGRQVAGADSNHSDTFLTFTLGSEDYGISILAVREIIGMMGITPIPRTPDYVKGVINLRGQVTPVIDLRAKFGMAEKPYDERTCIIVIEIHTGERVAGIGVVVDAVNEVAKIAEGEIEATPSFGVALSTDFILGMAKQKSGVNILLDIERVIVDDRHSLLEMAA